MHPFSRAIDGYRCDQHLVPPSRDNNVGVQNRYVDILSFVHCDF